VVTDGFGDTEGTFLGPLQAGDEVAGFAFEFVAFALIPFAGAADELASAGKEADLPVDINPGGFWQ